MAGETGDRVNFVDNERLDKDDALAMQTLGQAAQTRMLGAIFGTAGLDTALYGGVLEGVAATWDGTLKALTVGKGLFLDSQQGTSPSGGTVARVVRHDPSTPGQNSVVDLTAQAATSAACIIWGKRREINGPLGTRRKWNVGTAAEQNVSLATTIAERVEFTVRAATFSGSVPTAYTDPGSTWFPVIGIRSWTTGTPNTIIMGAFDAYRNGGGTFGDVGSTMLATAGLLADGVSMGLARILKVVRMSLARIAAQDGTVSWLTQGIAYPYRGLKELDTDLATTEASLATLTTGAEIRTWYSTLVSYYVTYDAGTTSWVVNSTYRLGAYAYAATGEFTFTTAAGVMAGGGGEFLTVTGVTVTPRGNSSAPTVSLAWTIELTTPSAGVSGWIIRFYDANTLAAADPDATSGGGFFVTATALCGAL